MFWNLEKTTYLREFETEKKEGCQSISSAKDPSLIPTDCFLSFKYYIIEDCQKQSSASYQPQKSTSLRKALKSFVIQDLFISPKAHFKYSAPSPHVLKQGEGFFSYYTQRKQEKKTNRSWEDEHSASQPMEFHHMHVTLIYV